MRQRTLSPRFWCDEDLADLPAGTRLLFAGLWGLADRDGRLEHRPRRFRLELHLHDVNVEAAIGDLIGCGKVIAYEVDGVAYLLLPGFAKYGHPHPKEVASVLPPPAMESNGKPRHSTAIRAGSSVSSVSSGPSGSMEEPKGSPHGVGAQVFELWRVETRHLAAKFTEQRKRAVRARLREGYSGDDLCDAVRGVALDPWPERVHHNDLAVICRDGAHVEKFRDLWRNPHPVVALPRLTANPLDRRIHEFGRGLPA